MIENEIKSKDKKIAQLSSPRNASDWWLCQDKPTLRKFSYFVQFGPLLDDQPGSDLIMLFDTQHLEPKSDYSFWI